MALVAVTTVVRHVDAGSPSSFMHVVDLAKSEVVLTAAVPDSDLRRLDANPRGGMRGARGISVAGDRLVLAQNERLFILSHKWEVIGELSHPLMGGIHDVLAEEHGIWVTSTSADLLVLLGWGGRLRDTWLWRKDERLVSRLGFGRLPEIDFDHDYRVPVVGSGAFDLVHLNSLTRTPEGLLISFGLIVSPGVRRRRAVRSRLARTGMGFVGARSAVNALRRRRSHRRGRDAIPVAQTSGGSFALIRLPHDGKSLRGASEVVLQLNGTRVPNHNVIELDDLLVYNDSNASRLVARHRDTGAVHAGVDIPGSPAFARGLIHLGAQRFLVGSQRPASLHTVDLARRRVVGSTALDGLPNETVFGIAKLPGAFEPPQHSPWA